MIQYRIRVTKTMVNPVVYASSNTLQKCNVLAIRDEFAEELATMNGKCMDIGCGPGDITKNIILPALDPEAVMIGTDISEDMIKYADEKYSDNVQTAFEVLDVQTKHLPKEYVSEFNHIFSFHALHWCSDVRQAFSNIYEMLQPGGTMLVLLVASHDVFDVFNQLSQNPRYAPYIPDKSRLVSPFQYSTEPQRQLKRIVKDVGFHVIHCSLREKTYFHVDSHTFLPAIMSFISFLDQMPQKLKTEFLEEFKNEYMKRKLIFKRLQNNKEQTIILDIYKDLVIYAEK